VRATSPADAFTAETAEFAEKHMSEFSASSACSAVVVAATTFSAVNSP
jgi:hypothetical protein